MEKEEGKSQKDQKETEDEVDEPEKDPSPKGGGGDGTQELTRGAPDSTDFFHLQGDYSTSVQETSSQHLTSKELDKEAGIGQADESSKELDEEVEGDSTQ